MFVEAVARKLELDGVSVFYDRFEDTNLWGKDLYSYLTDIYQNRALYTVIFISSAYAKKSWANLERRAAQARAFSENAECILPAVFDKGVEIPGILPTTGYIDLTSVTPEQLGEKIVKKLRADRVFLLPEEKFTYSADAKADIDFSLNDAGKLKTIIRDIKSHDWYTQNPAIEKMPNLSWSDVTPDQVFILGRNIYQSACGGARSAIRLMKNIRRELAELPLAIATHLLNGMLYEVYFDSKGEFRGEKLKSGYMNELLEIQTAAKYNDSIAFIRRALTPYRQSLAIIPSTAPEIVEVKVTISKRDPPILKSVECMGKELLVSTAENDEDFARPNLWKLSLKAFTLEGFKTAVAEAWHVPPDQLRIESDSTISKDSQVRLPKDTTIIQPFE